MYAHKNNSFKMSWKKPLYRIFPPLFEKKHFAKNFFLYYARRKEKKRIIAKRKFFFSLSMLQFLLHV